MVLKENKIYGKPKNEIQAKEYIKELLHGDKTHYIITGISIIIDKDGKYKEFKTYDKVKIFFKNIWM